MSTKTVVGAIVLVVAWVIWSFVSPLMQATSPDKLDPSAGPGATAPAAR